MIHLQTKNKAEARREIMDKDMKFEQALSDLEELVKSLENGQLPLEDAIQAFEKGVALKTVCEEKLKQAQIKIEKVMNKNGKVDITPFDT